MPFEKTKLDGVWLFKPRLIQDERGLFYESFREDRVFDETGFNFRVQQVNTSQSKPGVLRGIHFNRYPPGQAKFVTVSRGKILDATIDLRKNSATFGKWEVFELSAENRFALLIGYGIGHSFLALQESTVTYLCDSVYQPELEVTINPLKSEIDWHKIGRAYGFSNFICSAKDSGALGLSESLASLFD